MATGDPLDTLLLFDPPSFRQGAATAADLFGTTFAWNDSNNPTQADYLALRADWIAVGQAIRASIREIIEKPPEL